ncbi:MAG: hypothetical protein DRJ05_01510 [Bacteroidetes bacterium]|nr:MAG: hypothetical protein DRJ05_01510 [Bacteroidota bacterium]
MNNIRKLMTNTNLMMNAKFMGWLMLLKGSPHYNKLFPRRYIVLLFIMFSIAGSALSKDLTINSAINMASHQGMLTQRIVKTYIMIGSDIDHTEAHKERDYSIAMFGMQQFELEEFAPTKEIGIMLDHVYLLWSEFRLIAVGDPNKMDAYDLLSRSDELLKTCNKVVVMLEEYSHLDVSKYVHTSGKMGMLSQQIAMWYFADYWGFPSNGMLSFNIPDKYDESVKDYHRSFHKLMKSRHNTPEIRDALNIVKSYWNLPNTKLGDMKKSEMSPELIYKSMEKILNKMEKVTKMYELLDT